MTAIESRSYYTRGDSFSVAASREHIERALVGFGATEVRFSQRGTLDAVAFRASGRQFRIVLSLPQCQGSAGDRCEPEEAHVREVGAKAMELHARRFWHAFALATDAKLAAVTAGVATLESEFLAHVVLPGNQTVIDELGPVIASAYRSGRRPSIRTAVARATD